MNTIEKLENAISEIIAQIEENNRIDRITKEKLVNNISNLWNITSELKDSRDKTWGKLNELLKDL